MPKPSDRIEGSWRMIAVVYGRHRSGLLARITGGGGARRQLEAWAAAREALHVRLAPRREARSASAATTRENPFRRKFDPTGDRYDSFGGTSCDSFGSISGTPLREAAAWTRSRCDAEAGSSRGRGPGLPGR